MKAFNVLNQKIYSKQLITGLSERDFLTYYLSIKFISGNCRYRFSSSYSAVDTLVLNFLFKVL